MGAIAALGVGCQAADDDEDLVVDLAEEEDEAGLEEQSTVHCEDIRVTVITHKVCGILGPSPVVVKCTQECVTDRHLAFIPPTPTNPGGLQCVNGETTCGPVNCPPCD